MSDQANRPELRADERGVKETVRSYQQLLLDVHRPSPSNFKPAIPLSLPTGILPLENAEDKNFKNSVESVQKPLREAPVFQVPKISPLTLLALPDASVLDSIKLPTMPITAENRLSAVNKLAANALLNFGEINSSGNRFISEKEISNLAQRNDLPILRDSSPYIISESSWIKFNIIKNLYDDDIYHHSNGRGGTGHFDHNNQLGISKNDLQVLKVISGSDRAELGKLSARIAAEGNGGIWLISGGVISVASISMTAVSRLGWLGFGLGITMAGIGFGYTYSNARSRLEHFRMGISQDSSLDKFVQNYK